MDMRIYCLKCKTKTDTSDITKTWTRNNRNLIRGICLNCGMKNQFSCRLRIMNHQWSRQQSEAPVSV